MRSSLKDGYITVEATIVIPTVLACFVLLMYLVIFIYDRTIMYQDTYSMAIYAKEEYFNDKKGYLKAMDRHFLTEKEERPYLSLGNLNMTLSKKGNGMKVSSSGDFYTPFGKMLLQIFGIKDGTIEIEESVKLYDPVKIMLMTKDLVE